jgi:hypothetical protein
MRLFVVPTIQDNLTTNEYQISVKINGTNITASIIFKIISIGFMRPFQDHHLSYGFDFVRIIAMYANQSE